MLDIIGHMSQDINILQRFAAFLYLFAEQATLYFYDVFSNCLIPCITPSRQRWYLAILTIFCFRSKMIGRSTNLH